MSTLFLHPVDQSSITQFTTAYTAPAINCSPSWGCTFVNSTPNWWNLTDKIGNIICHFPPYNAGNVNFSQQVTDYVYLVRDLGLPVNGQTINNYDFRIRLDHDIQNNVSSGSIYTQAGTINFAGSLAAGNNHIGQVGIDGFTVALPAGANNIGSVNVAALPALPAGANAIGTVGVTSLPALAAGAAAIGTVGVTALPALPAGANAIGTVGVTTLPNIAEIGVSAQAQVAVGAAAVQVVIATGTRSFSVKNMDAAVVLYVGTSNAVTTANGYPINPKESFGFDVDPAAVGAGFWLIAPSAITAATISVK